MSDTKNLSKEELWDEIIDLKKKLAIANSAIEAIEPQLIAFKLFKGHYLTMTHVVPESFGFKEMVTKDDNGTMRIYMKGNVAMTKLPNNKWMMAKTVVDSDGKDSVQRAEFELRNKFETYHVLRAFGVKLD